MTTSIFNSSLTSALCIALFTLLESAFPRSSRPVKLNLKHAAKNIIIGSLSILAAVISYRAISKWFLPSGALLTPKDHLPFWAEILACVLIFDFASWCWHWLNHHIPLLWRSHAVHHTDNLLNSSSALRFHYFELFPSQIIRGALAAWLGFSENAFSVFVVLYIFFNFFEHSNLKLPGKLERLLGLLFITPALHHLHHVTDPKYYNGNLGTIFSIWDRFLGYRRWMDQTPTQFGLNVGQKDLSVPEAFIFPLQKM